MLEPLPPHPTSLLPAARPGPDLAALGWSEQEYAVTGRAGSYAPARSEGALPTDGRWEVVPADEADFVTRLLVRRPGDPARCSGTVVVEWLNVSSGRDAAPDWTYLAEEVVRQGHVWAGVSAQHAGVEGGGAVVEVAGLGSPGLKGDDPGRYGRLTHPGDAYCYDVFTDVSRALREELEATGVAVDRMVAVGESQSALALTTYLNAVHPSAGLFDGFLVHSRPGAAAPLGVAGAGLYAAGGRSGEPTRFRDDLETPVICVQTETDVLGLLDYLPARQPDHDRLRVWEVAGTAHADRFQIGELEAFLDCGGPVNRGQQVFVVRAALRHLDGWVRGVSTPPAAPPLQVVDGAFVTDGVGNVLGGVRTPAVDAPTSVLTGLADPGASMICRLFGRTTPLAEERLRDLYGTRAAYVAAYEAATERAVAAGFVLAEDRAEVLAEAEPDRVPG